MNNHDVIIMKQKEMGHPTDTELGRGRPHIQQRGLVRGQGQGSPPVVVNTGGGE